MELVADIVMAAYAVPKSLRTRTTRKHDATISATVIDTVTTRCQNWTTKLVQILPAHARWLGRLANAQYVVSTKSEIFRKHRRMVHHDMEAANGHLLEHSLLSRLLFKNDENIRNLVDSL
ncbi:hypothetical protein MHU86_21896 [Fragilaria crotonensis]|nr:hypothetical protein MHU86_21896 [Fragilaria crotonensis]